MKRFDAIQIIQLFQLISVFRDCSVYKTAKPSLPNGMYLIQPDANPAFNAFCDMTTAGGGWTVLQRRLTGDVSFERTWNEYKNGFGNPNGDFWLGNEYVHRLTTGFYCTLRIELKDFAGNSASSEHTVVTIGDETSKYTLSLEGLYTGTEGNAMSAHASMKFTTSDSDNDINAGSNCATLHRGGFWYNKDCIKNGASPNGVFPTSASSNQDGILWKSWKNSFENIKYVQMMVRPPNYGT